MNAWKLDPSLLDVLAGNQSMVDLPRLNLHTLDQAQAFLQAYGFDLTIERDQKKALYYLRRAYIFLIEKLDVVESSLPEEIKNLETPQTILNLLLGASQLSNQHLQKFSCAILRVMHAFIHAENDLFHLYSQDIQQQILSPFQKYVSNQGPEAQVYLKGLLEQDRQVNLVQFEVKPHKTSVSSVIKLLSKAETHMINLFDKIGVRFVTHTVVDSFRVLQFLLDNHLVSPAHVMAGQTTNTLFPISLLQNFILQNPTYFNLSDHDLEQSLRDFQRQEGDSSLVVKKDNQYSAGNYRFIKFVARRLIRLPGDQGQFFYPYEVQILTNEAYQMTLKGEGDHRLYKQRQLEAARRRVLN